jgi:hypothetical protein
MTYSSDFQSQLTEKFATSATHQPLVTVDHMTQLLIAFDAVSEKPEMGPRLPVGWLWFYCGSERQH